MKTHFWIGHFQNENRLASFFEEHYDEYGDEVDCEFFKSQSEEWIDHDFIEYGFEEGGATIKEKFKGYSYAEYWINHLQEVVNTQKISQMNTMVMYTQDGDSSDIKQPVSFNGSGYEMTYVGMFEFDI